MNTANAIGTVLIHEFASLPGAVAMEFTSFAPDWSIVRKFNGYELTRKIEAAHWSFFSLAGGSSAIAIGRDVESTLARAVRRVLAKRALHGFNAMEITGAVAKKFLGIPYILVTANSRHLQESVRLSAPVSLALIIAAKHQTAELVAQQAVAQIPSL